MQRILICNNWSISISGLPEYLAKLMDIDEEKIRDWLWDESPTGLRSDELVLNEVQAMNMTFPTEIAFEGSGRYAKFAIVEIPDDVEWYIDQPDGCGPKEIIVEKHRVWSCPEEE
jgi:hypothetical protein